MELVGLRYKILIIGVVDDWILQRMSPGKGVGGRAYIKNGVRSTTIIKNITVANKTAKKKLNTTY